eukprot:g2661.t1
MPASGCVNGRGVYIYTNTSGDGTEYDANTSANTSANSAKYDGEWKDGKEHGRGVFTCSSDGRFYGATDIKYDGEWKNGNKHGRGVLTAWQKVDNWLVRVFSFGLGPSNHYYKYDGEWKDDKQHGRGVETHENGYKYDGEWKDGKYHGRGVRHVRGFLGNGGFPLIKGQAIDWREALYLDIGCEFMLDRDTSYNFMSDYTYDGEWKDGKQHGRGTLTWANGNKYDGNWKDGNWEGGHWQHSTTAGHGGELRR